MPTNHVQPTQAHTNQPQPHAPDLAEHARFLLCQLGGDIVDGIEAVKKMQAPSKNGEAITVVEFTRRLSWADTAAYAALRAQHALAVLHDAKGPAHGVVADREAGDPDAPARLAHALRTRIDRLTEAVMNNRWATESSSDFTTAVMRQERAAACAFVRDYGPLTQDLERALTLANGRVPASH